MIPVISYTAWTKNAQEGFLYIPDLSGWTAHACWSDESSPYNLPPVEPNYGIVGKNEKMMVRWGTHGAFKATVIIIIRHDEGGVWHAPFRIYGDNKEPLSHLYRGGPGNDDNQFIIANASLQVPAGPSVSRFVIAPQMYAPDDAAIFYPALIRAREVPVHDGYFILQTEKKNISMFSVREFRHHNGGLVDGGTITHDPNFI